MFLLASSQGLAHVVTCCTDSHFLVRQLQQWKHQYHRSQKASELSSEARSISSQHHDPHRQQRSRRLDTICQVAFMRHISAGGVLVKGQDAPTLYKPPNAGLLKVRLFFVLLFFQTNLSPFSPPSSPPTSRSKHLVAPALLVPRHANS